MIESSAFVEDNFNDFLFWRRPLPPLEGVVGGNPCRHSPAQPATYTSSVSQSRASSRQEHEEDSTFNDFFFWRRPLSPLPQSVLSPIVAPTPGSPTPALSPPLRASPPPLGVGAEEELDDDDDDWQRVDEGEYGEEDDGDGDDPAAALLAGGAGASLIAVLASLTAHLDRSNSRFAQAAGMLSRDLLEMRAASQRSAAESPLRVMPTPADGSTLAEPQVLNSMRAILPSLDGVARAPSVRVLDDEGVRPEAAQQLAPLMLQFAGTDAVPTPASPQAVAALPSVEYRHDVVAGDDCFVLDDGEVMRGEAGGEEALRCSICLDPLRDATLLRMPCARNHIFHKICLLAWLETKNSCPVCRHRLPTEADEAEEREVEARARLAAAAQARAAAAAAAAAAAEPEAAEEAEMEM